MLELKWQAGMLNQVVAAAAAAAASAERRTQHGSQQWSWHDDQWTWREWQEWHALQDQGWQGDRSEGRWCAGPHVAPLAIAAIAVVTVVS